MVVVTVVIQRLMSDVAGVGLKVMPEDMTEALVEVGVAARVVVVMMLLAALLIGITVFVANMIKSASNLDTINPQISIRLFWYFQFPAPINLVPHPQNRNSGVLINVQQTLEQGVPKHFQAVIHLAPRPHF